MADDIDIEEHDVLDNPLIKNMFPDISTIKTEVEDYEEIPIYEELPYQSLVPLTFEEDNDSKAFQNKIILGTKPTTSHTPLNIFQNKIILGSKTCTPNISDNETDDYIYNMTTMPEVSVLLKDWSPILNNSTCYCKSCQILFATENALDSHKMTAHSFLVAVGNNKAVKSTSKCPLVAKIKVEPDERQDLICIHCNQVFPNEIALIKHTYELLPGNYQCEDCDLTLDSESAYKIHKSTHSSTELYFLCQVCTCHFKWSSKLISHLKGNHRIAEVGIYKQSPSNLACRLCGFMVKDSKNYNAHIQANHTQLYNKVAGDEKVSKFKCLQCNLSFSSDYSVRIHRAAKHGHVDDAKAQSKSRDQSPKTTIDIQKLVLDKTRPTLLPKSTIYKCDKCQIHFVSCSIAVQHSMRCARKAGEWKCQKCKRSFGLFDRASHNYQHEITDRFKVIEVDANTLKRLICRCWKCKGCGDELNLQSFHSDGCSGKNKSVQCPDCNLSIHAFSISAHRRSHIEGLSLKDLIVVDYVHAGAKLATVPAGNVSKSGHKAYFYCPTCKCFMQRNRHVDKHNIGKCNREAKRITCKHCGLTFSPKALANHRMQLKSYPKMKLRDMIFTNTQTGALMKPPLPDFKKCRRCNVRFFSTVALNNHLCHSEEPKVCVYCKEKFSDLAYNLHVPFHEYGKAKPNRKAITENILDLMKKHESGKSKPKPKAITENIPELMKKYESLKRVWNIIFLCDTCDIVIDTYDKVVEHCQDHFYNMESYNVTINHCEVCDLKFVNECFERHEELHLTDDVTSDSFKILKYKYDTLMTDAWSDIFNGLTKEQVELVLSKSIYKFTRSVRMKIVTDGPQDLTVYKCEVCELIVSANKVAEHALTTKCIYTPKRYVCRICNFTFVTKIQQVAHEKSHEERRLDEKSFRIVQFHAEKQFDIGDLQPKVEIEPADLKFIRCQHCGKLINKQKYKGHIKYHVYYNKVKARAKVPSKQKPNLPPKTMHNFYKCKECGLCVSKKRIREHYCDAETPKRKCHKCFLYFKGQGLPMHYRYHEKFQFSRRNINVILFENGVINEKVVPIRKPKMVKNKIAFYQCADCLLCINKQCNIKRHVCPTDKCRATCNLCNLKFHSSRQQFHKQTHELKAFNSKNVFLIKFRNGKIISRIPKLASESRRRQSSPSDVPVTKKLKIKPDIEVDDTNDTLKEHQIYTNMYYKCTICQILFVTCEDLLVHEETCCGDTRGIKCNDCGLILYKSAIKSHRTLQKCSLNKSNVLCLMTVQSRGKTPHDEWTYLCEKCDVYIMTQSELKHHMEKGHKHLSPISECGKCDIKFSRHSHALHLKRHHGAQEVPLSDLGIALAVEATFESVLKDLADDSLESCTTPVASKDSTPKDKYSPVLGIFGCHVCGLNFINRSTLSAHKSYGRHDEKQYSCPQCGLSFTGATLKRHIEVHHQKNKNAATNDLKENETNIAAKNNKKAVIKDLKDSGSSNTSSKDNITENVSRTCEPSPSQVANTSPNKTKLFKCSPCDVYFLSMDTCYEHTSDHTPLDPTEYIACKMCELQFACEDLGKHMRCHRDSSFCVDNLTVAEYQPVNKGQIKIDTYLAADRLKTKLVSTTTHSDNEEEKVGNGVNCVDSTTENVAEDVENNAPHTSAVTD